MVSFLMIILGVFLILVSALIGCDSIGSGLIVCIFGFILLTGGSLLYEDTDITVINSPISISGPAVFIEDGKDVKLRYKDKEYSTGGNRKSQYKRLTEYYKSVILDNEEDLIKEVDKNNKILEELYK